MALSLRHRPDQLPAAGRSWKAYVESQDASGPAGQAASCRRPADGQPVPWRAPPPGDAGPGPEAPAAGRSSGDQPGKIV